MAIIPHIHMTSYCYSIADFMNDFKNVDFSECSKLKSWIII